MNSLHHFDTCLAFMLRKYDNQALSIHNEFVILCSFLRFTPGAFNNLIQGDRR